LGWQVSKKTGQDAQAMPKYMEVFIGSSTYVLFVVNP